MAKLMKRQPLSTAERMGLHLFNEWNPPTDFYRKQVAAGLQKEREL